MVETSDAIGTLLRKAEYKSNCGYIQDAIEIYEQVLAGFPDHPGALFGRAKMLGRKLKISAQKGEIERAWQYYVCLFRPEIDRGSSDVFERMYFDGLCKTLTSPLPIRRRERLRNLLELFNNAPQQGADLAECGCGAGLSTYMLCSAEKHRNNAFLGEGMHVFDSFQGLSEPGLEDAVTVDHPEHGGLSNMSRKGNFAASLTDVLEHLHDFPEVVFHPGWIPERFNEVNEERFRFVHVDVDLYQPTLDAFRFFYPRLVPGGVIVSDDGNWPGALRGIREFAEENRLMSQQTPTGQIYFIRA